MKPQAVINRLERAGIRKFLGERYELRATNSRLLTDAMRRLVVTHSVALADYFLAEYDAALPGRLTPTLRRKAAHTNDLDTAVMRELWRIAHSQGVRS